MNYKMFVKNKKAVSVIIGYVLLVVFAIIISAIVFQWLRTYIPSSALECPEGVSLFVNEANFDPAEGELEIKINNNGKFNVAGYFIHIKNDSEQVLALIDISEYLNESRNGTIFGNSILFSSDGESVEFRPGIQEIHYFNIPEEFGIPYSIRITPTRFQEYNQKNRFTSCGNARVEVIVSVLNLFIVFATSQGGFNGNLGGLSGADTTCNNLATNAGLNGTFAAWLSTSNINAKDRILDVPYALPDINGQPKIRIARNKEDLIKGSIEHPINLTEFGLSAQTQGGVWTGTNAEGISTGINCNEWTSSSRSSTGNRGRSTNKDSAWTNSNLENCNDEARRLYCFQISE